LEKTFGISSWGYVFLNVVHWKNMIQFGMRGKLTPAYIGSFEVIGKTGLDLID
jgi:hypothetical protein